MWEDDGLAFHPGGAVITGADPGIFNGGGGGGRWGSPNFPQYVETV